MNTITISTARHPMTVNSNGRVLCTVGSRRAAAAMKAALEWSGPEADAQRTKMSKAARKSWAKLESRRATL